LSYLFIVLCRCSFGITRIVFQLCCKSRHFGDFIASHSSPEVSWVTSFDQSNWLFYTRNHCFAARENQPTSARIFGRPPHSFLNYHGTETPGYLSHYFWNGAHCPPTKKWFFKL
jgi:hypothetical protein